MMMSISHYCHVAIGMYKQEFSLCRVEALMIDTTQSYPSSELRLVLLEFPSAPREGD